MPDTNQVNIPSIRWSLYSNNISCLRVASFSSTTMAGLSYSENRVFYVSLVGKFMAPIRSYYLLSYQGGCHCQTVLLGSRRYLIFKSSSVPQLGVATIPSRLHFKAATIIQSISRPLCGSLPGFQMMMNLCSPTES